MMNTHSSHAERRNCLRRPSMRVSDMGDRRRTDASRGRLVRPRKPRLTSSTRWLRCGAADRQAGDVMQARGDQSREDLRRDAHSQRLAGVVPSSEPTTGQSFVRRLAGIYPYFDTLATPPRTRSPRCDGTSAGTAPERGWQARLLCPETAPRRGSREQIAAGVSGSRGCGRHSALPRHLSVGSRFRRRQRRRDGRPRRARAAPARRLVGAGRCGRRQRAVGIGSAGGAALS